MKIITILLLSKICTDRLNKMTGISLKWPPITSQWKSIKRISKRSRHWLQENKRNERPNRRKAKRRRRSIRIKKIRKTRTVDQESSIKRLQTIMSLKLTIF